MVDNSSSRSAIGGAQQQGNVTYGVMNEQVVKDLQQASTSSPGTDFIVIQRVRQGEHPRIWSTGDQEQTKSLFRDAYTSLAFEKDLERS
jgi:hypothetical protein